MNDNILESISDGVFTVDNDWKITYFNKSAERITGIRRASALGRLCCEVFKSNMCESDCPLLKTVVELLVDDAKTDAQARKLLEE
ncbi:MAG: PAS domain-containing protein, partial [Spirochaetota bacterium]